MAGKFEYSNLQFSSSSQIGQHFDHVIGHGRSYGQVSTGRLESVLISHPINFDDGAISFDVRVAAAHDSAHTFRILRVDLLLRAALWAFDAIFRLETEDCFYFNVKNLNWIFCLNETTWSCKLRRRSLRWLSGGWRWVWGRPGPHVWYPEPRPLRPTSQPKSTLKKQLKFYSKIHEIGDFWVQFADEHSVRSSRSQKQKCRALQELSIGIKLVH